VAYAVYIQPGACSKDTRDSLGRRVRAPQCVAYVWSSAEMELCDGRGRAAQKLENITAPFTQNGLESKD
jgi:hypothetical protein